MAWRSWCTRERRPNPATRTRVPFKASNTAMRRTPRVMAAPAFGLLKAFGAGGRYATGAERVQHRSRANREIARNVF